MKQLMTAVASDDLHMYIIWLPMLRTDNDVAAVEAARELTEPRVQHFWDSERWSGDTWDGVLSLGATAWDVYFVYGRDAAWSDHPTYPDMWMHQLSSAGDRAPFLDFDQLRTSVEQALAHTP